MDGKSRRWEWRTDDQEKGVFSEGKDCQMKVPPQIREQCRGGFGGACSLVVWCRKLTARSQSGVSVKSDVRKYFLSTGGAECVAHWD